MNRKKFLEAFLQAGVGGYFLSPFLSSCKSAQNWDIKDSLPNYWIWVRHAVHDTEEEWKRDFSEIRELGIEALLPQIFNGTEAFFTIDDFESKGPVLERMIPIAHEAGLQVHAWMWTMPCTNKRILQNHPDWYVVNKLGQPANTHPAYVNYYNFLCPKNPEVREFVQNRVRALATISELDGIHLDYVRMPDVILAEGLQPDYNIVQDREYPQYDYCYCETCRKAYQEKTGIDPLTLEDPANNSDWYQFRYDAVVELVNQYLVPVAKEKNKLITAAVFPNWESVRQQWHLFDLDGFMPMLYHDFYNEDIHWIGEETKKAIQRLNNKIPIYSGLYLDHLQPDELELAVDAAHQSGASGFSMFSYYSLQRAMKEQTRKIINKLESKSR